MEQCASTSRLDSRQSSQDENHGLLPRDAALKPSLISTSDAGAARPVKNPRSDTSTGERAVFQYNSSGFQSQYMEQDYAANHLPSSLSTFLISC